MNALLLNVLLFMGTCLVADVLRIGKIVDPVIEGQESTCAGRSASRREAGRLHVPTSSLL